jgi:hypothetical protein
VPAWRCVVEWARSHPRKPAGLYRYGLHRPSRRDRVLGRWGDQGLPWHCHHDPGDRSKAIVRPVMTHFFYMDEANPSKVRSWIGSVGPVAF